MGLAYKSVLKRHSLITLPLISVNFLFKAEFQPGSAAKFFSMCMQRLHFRHLRLEQHVNCQEKISLAWSYQ